MSNRIISTFICMMSAIALIGCTSLTTGANEPPRPTIVPVTSTPAPEPTQAISEVETASVEVVEAAAIEEAGDSSQEAIVAEAPTDTPSPPPTDTPSVQQPPLDSLTLGLTAVAEGFTKPLYLSHAGDGSGRLFIVEQAGLIKIIENGVVNPTPFLDIVSIVGSSANEQGLLSVAFHPDYVNNGLFFVNYTNRQGDTIIARYSVSDDPAVADPSSEQVLLTIGQPYGNHNGGQVKFGADGYLYVGMGDGGAANDPQDNAQNLGSLLGKILRLDVDNGQPYGVPDNNPFVSNEEARPEIWSYGWRNPWRFSFDRTTADMYIADVGQNQYEEVHVEWGDAAGGQNYGWRLMEGFHCFNPSECDPDSLNVVLPITEYDHSQGCSITGGYVYRGQQYPALEGTYLYGDYCTGIIWGLRQEPDGSWSQAELLRVDHQISSFGEDEAGELYLIAHNGPVLQIVN